MKIQHLLMFTLLFLVNSPTIIAQINDTALLTSAENHLKSDAEKNKVIGTDLAEYTVTDAYTSQGISHIYYQQSYQGISIAEGRAAVHLKNDTPFYSDFTFSRDLENKVNSTQPTISIETAIRSFAKEKKADATAEIFFPEVSFAGDRRGLAVSNISREDISYRLRFLNIQDKLRLTWNFTIYDTASADIWEADVDALTGRTLRTYNHTIYCDFGEGNHDHDHSHCENHSEAGMNHTAVAESSALSGTYRVFPYPVESPNFGNRALISQPHLDNETASPDGWHKIFNTEYTVTRGNNTDSYADQDDSNSPTGGNAARANGGSSLNFDFPWTANGNQSSYKDAAVTNLFYWTNLTHDVWYNYGFDEPSGNFQENNFGRGGLQGDGVSAEAQDGGGTCNANFGTPPDGGNPRMQMYLCNGRDGDYDNGVIVHEYGHGISIRLAGGPSTSGCLGTSEQMGEGWSDYFGMVMTIENGDQGTDSRGMGTWLFGQGPNGDGIRPFPYSTDLDINPMTYNSIDGVSIPHGVGSVWATMLWEMTWALIDEHGFDPDLYNGTGGNNIAMALVIEGLKLMSCSPGFIDGRDGILAADEALYGGENHCLIWEAFAKRGLGYSADQGNPNSVTDGTEGYDMPPSCTIGLTKTADQEAVAPGGLITYTLTATNNTSVTQNNVIISDDLPSFTDYISGGDFDGTTVSFPAVNLAPGASTTASFTVQVSTAAPTETETLFEDDMEAGGGSWTTSGDTGENWTLQNGTSASGSWSWFAEDIGTPAEQYLILANTIPLDIASELSFTHSYNTEATWDGGIIEISTDFGVTWTDLGDNITTNGYNSTVYNNPSRPAFSGNSNGFITTTVDLSAYAGQSILIRFNMITDTSVSGQGWYVDDVFIGILPLRIPNTAQVQSNDLITFASLPVPTEVLPGEDGEIDLALSVVAQDISCYTASDGSATAYALYGTGTYSYSWSTGATGQTVTNLLPGSHSVTVNDGENTVVRGFMISEPPELSAETETTGTVAGDDGSATIIPSGGTPPYTYQWNTGQSSASISNLVPGLYTVTLTDSRNCTINPITVEVMPCPDYILTLNILLDNYPEETSWELIDETGDIVANSNGTYSGEPDGTLVSESFCVLPGCYTFTIFDSYGDGICCGFGLGNYELISTVDNTVLASGGEFSNSESTDFCLQERVLGVAVNNQTDVSCTGGSDGTATASAFFGTSEYTYLWSDGQSGATAVGLSAGQYSVTVNDGVDEVSAEVFILEPDAITITAEVTNVSEDALGTATISVQGGVEPYTYAWTGSESDEESISNVIAGVYEVTVTDDNDCTEVLSIVVGDDTACQENSFTLVLTLDEFPEQTTWTITDTEGNIIGSDGGVYPDLPVGLTLTYPFCVPDGCYTFTIEDEAGDGLCCRYVLDGSYSIVNDYTGETLAEGGVFDWSEATEFCFSNDPNAPVTYCGSEGENQNYEFIEAVSFNDYENESGDDGGYGDYTDNPIVSAVDSEVEFTLTPGFTSYIYTENWRIWVDLNADGDFYDIGEMVYSGTGNETLSGSFTIPVTAVQGDLRMRVAMKWGDVPTPCESFTYGEVEDYILQTGSPGFSGMAAYRQQRIGSPELYTFTNREGQASSLEVFPNPVRSDVLGIELRAAGEKGGTLQISDLGGQMLASDLPEHLAAGRHRLSISVRDLTSGVYFIRYITDGEIITRKFVLVR